MGESLEKTGKERVCMCECERYGAWGRRRGAKTSMLRKLREAWGHKYRNVYKEDDDSEQEVVENEKRVMDFV